MIAAGYARNSAPIDGTNILRSNVAMGRKFRFLIDINLSPLLQLTQNSSQSNIYCLRLTYSKRQFSSSILKLLIENCRTTHNERVNKNKVLSN